MRRLFSLKKIVIRICAFVFGISKDFMALLSFSWYSCFISGSTCSTCRLSNPFRCAVWRGSQLKGSDDSIRSTPPRWCVYIKKGTASKPHLSLSLSLSLSEGWQSVCLHTWTAHNHSEMAIRLWTIHPGSDRPKRKDKSCSVAILFLFRPWTCHPRCVARPTEESKPSSQLRGPTIFEIICAE
jgi:hypothetical protein